MGIGALGGNGDRDALAMRLMQLLSETQQPAPPADKLDNPVRFTEMPSPISPTPQPPPSKETPKKTLPSFPPVMDEPPPPKPREGPVAIPMPIGQITEGLHLGGYSPPDPRKERRAERRAARDEARKSRRDMG